MTLYSHNRLGCFEQCPLKYKLRYIDKVESKTEESIESFLGSRIHDVLEKLYRDIQNQKEDSPDELLHFLNDQWEKRWNDSIVILNKEYKQENYLKKGEKFISDYYTRYKPFNQGKTIGLEKRIIIDLDELGKYKLQGYIDRLVETDNGFYEIHDYKTAGRLPLQKDIDKDRQLSLYAIGINNNFPDCQDIDLVWHFLAFDKEMRSKRNEEELNQLKIDTIKLIDKIGATDKFPAASSILCNWCEYKPICNEWAHLYKLESKPANIYLDDTGVKLVNTYAEIQKRRKRILDEIDNQLEQIKEAIITFAHKENIGVVFSSSHKVKISVTERKSYPLKNDGKRDELNNVLKNAGKWDEVSELDVYALSRKLKDENWPLELISSIQEYQTIEKTERIYLRKIKRKEE